MDSIIKDLFYENNLNLCIECGKCSSICPLKDIFPEYSYENSPRGIINKFLFDFFIMNEKEILEDSTLWYCMTCTVCKNNCPAGVNFPGFISSLREVLLSNNFEKYACKCKRCENYFIPLVHLLYLKKKVSEEPVLDYCPKCRKRLLSKKVKENLPGRLIIKSER